MRLKTYAALAPYFVFFQAGTNEPPPFTVNGGDKLEQLAAAARITSKPAPGAPKKGTWLKFDRMPLLRHSELNNQPWTPPGKWATPKPPKVPAGWAAMTEEAFVRELLGSMG